MTRFSVRRHRGFARWALAGALLSFSVLSGRAEADTTAGWHEQTALPPLPEGGTPMTGRCAAFVGEMAVTGSAAARPAGLATGAVYTFAQRDGAWTHTQTLAPLDLPSKAWFGGACAATKDTLFVSASDAGAGFVYVYRLENGALRLLERFGPPAGSRASRSVYPRFGSSVATDGRTLVVGAPATDQTTGLAVIFRLDVSGHPTFESDVFPPGADDSENIGLFFGQTVGIDADTLGVGTVDERLFVAQRAPGPFSLQQTLALPGNDSLVRQDNKIVIAGNLLVASTSGAGRGAVHVFGRETSSGAFVERQVLHADQEADSFGSALVLFKDTLFVGAPGRDSSSGRVFTFLRRGDDFQAGAVLSARNAAAGALFGRSAAVINETLLITAPGRGLAYAFRNARDLGQSCDSRASCATGFCVDGVCCDAACGEGNPGDCQACARSAGAPTDGTCATLPRAHTCRGAREACDIAETCDGAAVTCSADLVAPNGAACPDGVCLNGTCTNTNLPTIGAAASTPPAPPSDSSGGCVAAAEASQDFSQFLFCGAVVVVLIRRRTLRSPRTQQRR